MHILVRRDSYSARTTLGKLYINGKYFCETLEDTVRANGIKVKRETALPECVCDVVITFSSRFKRDMPLLRTDNSHTVTAGGISFSGARFHGGNTHENTEGCPLVAKNRLDKDTIQGSMEKELTRLIKEAIDNGEKVVAEFVNLPQAE